MTQTSENRNGILNLRQALKVARHLGLDVRDNRGTGEVRVTLRGARPVNHNARRKDASRALMHLLRQAESEARLPTP